MSSYAGTRCQVAWHYQDLARPLMAAVKVNTHTGNELTYHPPQRSSIRVERGMAVEKLHARPLRPLCANCTDTVRTRYI